MNKSELIEALAQDINVPHREAAAITNTVIDTMTEALLWAIKSDVRHRVDDIVDRAERAAMTLDSEQQVDQLLEVALIRVEEAIAEAAKAMEPVPEITMMPLSAPRPPSSNRSRRFVATASLRKNSTAPKKGPQRSRATCVRSAGSSTN